MNCKNCNEESKPSCSKWIVSKVISLPFDTEKEAESFIETMKKGFIFKDSNLIVTEIRTEQRVDMNLK
jgi:hypothetical protein